MSVSSLMSDNSDFDLEYRDVTKDPTNPEMRQIAETVPERYKGKTVEDLINMHVNVEKVMHRRDNELGQLRKLVDTQSQLLAVSAKVGHIQPGQGAPVEPQRTDPLTAEAILTRPDEAINKAVSQNPSVTQQNTRLNNLELEMAKQTFEGAHKTFKDDLQNPEFSEWVQGSNVRSKLLQNLNNYDFGSGNELWELWGEHREAKAAADRARSDKVSAATTIRGSSAEVSQPGKPIYSRAKLAELQLKAERGDPVALARWNDPQFQYEYQLAYHEDRVK